MMGLLGCPELKGASPADTVATPASTSSPSDADTDTDTDSDANTDADSDADVDTAVPGTTGDTSNTTDERHIRLGQYQRRQRSLS